MDRITGANNVDIGGGRRGFRDRNLGLGQAGTIHIAQHHNGLQEEIIRAIERSGIVPSAADNEQLFGAIRRMANGASTQLNNGTFTLTADQLGWVQLNAASGNISCTLPVTTASGGNPQRVTLARLDATANLVTINAAAGDTIEGVASLTIGPGERVTLASNAANNWFLVSQAPLGLRGMQAFTASGNFIVPFGVRRVRVQCWGAGGGGGGTNSGSFNALANAGGAGAYGEGIYAVTPGASIPVTVGAAGAAGTTAPGNGGIGGTSSFGTLLSCTGGFGGSASGGGIATGGGGAGSATGGVINQAGATAQPGFIVGSNLASAVGGFSFGCGYGAIAVSSTAFAGYNSVTPGQGGNGAVGGTAPGGQGGPGLVWVTW